MELELAKVKRELAEVKMERDLLKKAAAYFHSRAKTSHKAMVAYFNSEGV
jgi:transposase-like protein